MATLEFTAIAQTSITVRIANLDEESQNNYGTENLPRHNRYEIELVGNDTRRVSRGGSGYSGSTTFAGLAPGTTYSFCGYVDFTNAKGNNSIVEIPDSATTLSGPSRPKRWNWYNGLCDAAATNMLKPGQAIPTYVQLASSWTAYLQNINDVRGYCGLSSYNFTPIVSGAPLSAATVREASSAIKAMSPGILPPAEAISFKTPISAALLNALTDSINSIG